MSAVGAATGAVVGLVAITPAAGLVSPAYAILIGAIGATVWAVQMLWIPIMAAGIINGFSVCNTSFNDGNRFTP